MIIALIIGTALTILFIICSIYCNKIRDERLAIGLPGVVDPISGDMEDVKKLQIWVNDLQSGMYVNCVYCGYRYGPKDGTQVSQSDILKAHVEKCPQHPMSALKKENENLKKLLIDNI